MGLQSGIPHNTLVIRFTIVLQRASLVSRSSSVYLYTHDVIMIQCHYIVYQTGLDAWFSCILCSIIYHKHLSFLHFRCIIYWLHSEIYIYIYIYNILVIVIFINNGNFCNKISQGTGIYSDCDHFDWQLQVRCTIYGLRAGTCSGSTCSTVYGLRAGGAVHVVNRG